MNYLIAGILCSAVLYTIPAAYASEGDPVRFTIDMTGPSTDTFLVEVDVPQVSLPMSLCDSNERYC